MGCTGLVWWAAGLVCVIGAVESLWMTEVGGRMSQPAVLDEEFATSEVLLAGGGPDGGCLKDMSASLKPMGDVYSDEMGR